MNYLIEELSKSVDSRSYTSYTLENSFSLLSDLDEIQPLSEIDNSRIEVIIEPKISEIIENKDLLIEILPYSYSLKKQDNNYLSTPIFNYIKEKSIILNKVGKEVGVAEMLSQSELSRYQTDIIPVIKALTKIYDSNSISELNDILFELEKRGLI